MIENRRSRRRDRAEVNDLRRLTTLSVLPDGVLEELAEQSSSYYYRRGEDVDWQDGEERLVLGVVDGAVTISFLASSGKELFVQEVRSKNTIDLGMEGWAAFDATMLTVCTPCALICTLPHAAFVGAVIHCPAAVRFLLVEHDRWLGCLGGAAEDGSHGPIARLHRRLMRDHRDRPDEGTQHTHEELARQIGTTRPIVTTEIGRLLRAGIIGVNREAHRIDLVAPERLADDLD